MVCVTPHRTPKNYGYCREKRGGQSTKNNITFYRQPNFVPRYSELQATAPEKDSFNMVLFLNASFFASFLNASLLYGCLNMVLFQYGSPS